MTFINFRRIALVGDTMIMDLLLDIVNDTERYTIDQRKRAAVVSRAFGTGKITIDEAKQYLTDIIGNHNIVLPVDIKK